MKWSFSAWDSYGTCPKKYELTKLKKVFVEPQGEHALWGTQVHEALEFAIRDGAPLEERMQQWAPLVERLRSAKGQVLCELELGITKELKPTDFHAEDVWCRGIVDIAILGGKKAFAGDFKTGKRKLTPQLKLMALLLFAHYPELEEISTAFIWLKDGGKLDVESFRREDMAKMWTTFFPRLNDMKESEKLDVYPAKRNGLCRNYCVVSSCPYNGSYRRESK